MKVLEIYFSDLTDEMQKEVLNFYNAENPEELGFDIAPMHILMNEEEWERRKMNKSKKTQIMEIICKNCNRVSLCLTLDQKENYCQTCDIPLQITKILENKGEKND